MNFDISEKIYIEIKYEVLKDNSSFCTNLFFSKNNQTLFQTFDDTISSEWSRPEQKKIGIYR